MRRIRLSTRRVSGLALTTCLAIGTVAGLTVPGCVRSPRATIARLEKQLSRGEAAVDSQDESPIATDQTSAEIADAVRTDLTPDGEDGVRPVGFSRSKHASSYVRHESAAGVLLDRILKKRGRDQDVITASGDPFLETSTAEDVENGRSAGLDPFQGAENGHLGGAIAKTSASEEEFTTRERQTHPTPEHSLAANDRSDSMPARAAGGNLFAKDFDSRLARLRSELRAKGATGQPKTSTAPWDTDWSQLVSRAPENQSKSQDNPFAANPFAAEEHSASTPQRDGQRRAVTNERNASESTADVVSRLFRDFPSSAGFDDELTRPSRPVVEQVAADEIDTAAEDWMVERKSGHRRVSARDRFATPGTRTADQMRSAAKFDNEPESRPRTIPLVKLLWQDADERADGSARNREEIGPLPLVREDVQELHSASLLSSEDNAELLENAAANRNRVLQSRGVEWSALPASSVLTSERSDGNQPVQIASAPPLLFGFDGMEAIDAETLAASPSARHPQSSGRSSLLGDSPGAWFVGGLVLLLIAMRLIPRRS